MSPAELLSPIKKSLANQKAGLDKPLSVEEKNDIKPLPKGVLADDVATYMLQQKLQAFLNGEETTTTEAFDKDKKYQQQINDLFDKYSYNKGRASAHSFKQSEDLVNRSVGVSWELFKATGEFISRKEIASQLKLLNRSAFLYEIMKTLGDVENLQDSNKKLTLLGFDMKGLRAADLAKDEYKLSSADVILNKVSQQILRLVQEMNGKYPNLKLNTTIAGGDEFLVSVIGDTSEQQIEEFKGRIVGDLKQIIGVYLNDQGREEYRTTGIKNDRVDIFETPKHKDEAIVYFHFLQNGLILESLQIAKTLEKFQDYNSELSETNASNITLQQYLDLKHPTSIYPNLVTTRAQKLEYVVQKLPSLRKPLYAAFALDVNSLVTNNKYKNFDSVLDFVENVVFDKLLKEVILSRGEFFGNLEEGKYKKTFDFEMKGVKEINDTMGAVMGDLGILDMYQLLKKTLVAENAEDLLKHVDIHRSSGAYLLGLKFDAPSNVVDYITSKLRDIQKIDLFSDDKDDVINDLPIGFAEKDFTKITPDEIGMDFQTRIDRFFEDALINWHNKVFRIMVNGNDSDRNKQLLIRFFAGKRHEERARKAMQALEALRLQEISNEEECDNFYQNKYDGLKSVLEYYLRYKNTAEFKSKNT